MVRGAGLAGFTGAPELPGGGAQSQAKLAAWPTEAGYPVKVRDVKNAGRSQLHENVSPATPEVMALLGVVKARFPRLETGRFLVRG